MSSTLRFIVLAAFIPTFLFAQSHFVPVASTGKPYHFILSTITVDGKAAKAGVEIGIFDSTTCVGAVLLSSDGQSDVSIVTWQGDSAFGLAGFRSGKPITAKVWANVYGTMKELEGQLQFTIGSGMFGDGSYSVTSLRCTTGVAPALLVVPASIDFGSVMTGISSIQNIVVKNIGNARLTVQPMSVNNPAFTMAINYTRIVSPADSFTVALTFTPVNASPYAATLSILSDDPATATVNVPLTGQGFPQLTAQISLSPSGIDFGDVRVGETIERPVQIYNPGSKDLHIYNIISTVSQMTPSLTAMTVPPGEYKNFKVIYAAQISSAINGSLTIYSDAANTSAAMISLSARPYSSYFVSVPPTGLPYTVVVNAVAIDNHALAVGDEIALYDDTLCVGSAVYHGTLPLSITAWKSSTDPAMKGYKDGDSIRVKVWASTFNRKALVDMQTTWSRGNKTFDYGDYSVIGITGKSYVDPIIGLSRNTMVFPSTEVGLNAVDTFVVRNSGLSVLTVSNISSSLSSFSASPANFVLPPGSSRTVTLTFAPATAMPLMGTVTIASDDPASPTKTVSVSGQGLTASTRVLTIGATAIRFDATVKGTSSGISITLFNGGSSTIRVTSIGFATAFFSTTQYSFDIAAGATVVLPILFSPTGIGTFGDSIRILNTSQNIPTATIKLSGLGFEGFFHPVTPTGKGYAIVLDTVKGFVGLVPQVSDEVGLFDGNMCVGTAVIGNAPVGGKVTGTAWEGDAARTMAGFASGHPLVFGYFTRRGSEARVYNMKYTMIQGDGTYGYQPMSVVQLTVDTTMIRPMLSTLKSSIDFGDVARGIVKRDTLRIVNGSINMLTVDSIYTKTPAFAVDRINGTVGPDTLKVGVSFTPTAIASYTDTLYLRNNSATPLVKIPLSGNSPALVLSASATSLAFSSRAKGDSATMTVYLRNLSISATTISGITTNTTAFTATSGSTTVAGGDSTILTVKFKPTSFGTFTDTVKVVFDGGTLKVALSGTSPVPIFTSLKTSIAYGIVAKNTTKQDTVKVVNSSINVLTIDSIYTKTSVFTCDKKSGVVSTDTLSVNVTFSPTITGSFIDTLYLKNNSLTALVKIPLSGSTPVPVLAVSVTLVRFGEKAKGDSVSRVISIINKSIYPLTVTSISVGTNAFVVDTATVAQTSHTLMKTRKNRTEMDDGEVVTISASMSGSPSPMPEYSLPVIVKDSMKVRIWFKPNRFGSFTDTLSIVSDGGTKKVPVIGNSPYPVLKANQQPLSFGAVVRNSMKQLGFKIANSSINTLTIDSIYSKTLAFTVDKRNGTVGTDTLSLNITFAPKAVGRYLDTLYIFNNSLVSPFKIPLDGNGVLTSVLEATNLIPDHYFISQNYPNPFNPTTMIEYGLPAKSSVRLQIFNILGQQITTLYDGEQAAGYQKAQWNADVSTGIYFYRIEAAAADNPNNAFRQVKKMILVR